MRDASLYSTMLWRTLLWLAITGALLFVSAGTLDWPQAWVFLAELGILGLLSGYFIARSDPDLLRERLRSPVQKDQKPWDKLLLMGMFALWMGQYVVAGLDAKRFATSQMPLWINVLGALGVAMGLYAFHAVLRANTFAAPVVKIQAERKHHVISTGPYALVRHPMYAGSIPMVIGTPLLLGSWYALLCGAGILAILAVRAVLEEETLRAELQGYEAYAQRVRYRLIPGVW
jgi:protein-S-isoprenylcysteine O-methyltransferase Ste14